MRARRIVALFAALAMLAARDGVAQVERVWLTHRTNDPGRLVVNWTTKEPGDSVVRFSTTDRYGQSARDEEPTILHRVEIAIPEKDVTYHYRVATGPHRSADATFKGYPTDELRVA